VKVLCQGSNTEVHLFLTAEPVYHSYSVTKMNAVGGQSIEHSQKAANSSQNKEAAMC
jgi:hypothetical protein